MPRSRTSRYDRQYRELLAMLRQWREDADVTQEDLAKRMKTSQSIVSKLEKGVVRLDLIELLTYLKGIDGDPVSFVRDFCRKIGEG